MDAPSWFLLSLFAIPFWFLLRWLWDTFCVRRTLEQCHPVNLNYEDKCVVCAKYPGNWRHWKMRLIPHEFRAHRVDMQLMKFCTECNKDPLHISHTGVKRGLFGSLRHEEFLYKAWSNEAIVERKVRELEEWHRAFREKHPEFEDSTRNELFPELGPSADQRADRIAEILGGK